jgi:mannose-6-phosphate isomerase-like protein (cupin superfamily)
MPQGTENLVVGPRDGESVRLRGLGVRFMLDGERTGGGFSLVEHPIEPRALAAPTHTHSNEDEYSYVLEGRMGAEIGDEVVIAEPGDLVVKPRGIPHAFWNAGDEPCRVLEFISPGGFERYFAEIAPLLEGEEPDMEAAGAVMQRYGLEMDFDSVPRLMEQHGLTG